MRGKYHMQDWERAKWEQEFTKIITRFSQNENCEEEDLTNYDLCPANVCETLKNLGWEEIDIDNNGWENDTSYTFINPDFNFYLIFNYKGYTFKMSIYRENLNN